MATLLGHFLFLSSYRVPIHPWPHCQAFSSSSPAVSLNSHHSFSDLLKRHQWVSTQAMAVVMNQAVVQEPQSAPAALSFLIRTSSGTCANTSHSENVEDYYLCCVLVLQLYPVIKLLRTFPKRKKQTKKTPIDFTKIKVAAGKQKENDITHSLKKRDLSNSIPAQQGSVVEILAITPRSATKQIPDTLSKQTATFPNH